MASGTVTLTQYNDLHAYCRFWNGAAFADYDAESLSIGGTPFTLWDSENAQVYVGKASTFAYIGFRVATAGAGYGAFSTFYSRTSTDYNIVSTTMDHSLSIATNLSAKFTDGTKFTISGSGGGVNDGEWTCDGDAVWNDPNTDITVVETLGGDTDDGKIDAHSIWAPLTILFNNTTSFSVSGYLAWAIPGDWGLSTLDSVSAFWMRSEQDEASPTTDATAYHLMRNVTLNEPIHQEGPHWTQETDYADINGAIQKKDMTYKSPGRLVLNITQMACSMGNLHLLHDWKLFRNDIYIQDDSYTGTVAPATVSPYPIMQGKINAVPTQMSAVGKMGLAQGGYYPLVFKIDVATSISELLGLTVA